MNSDAGLTRVLFWTTSSALSGNVSAQSAIGITPTVVCPLLVSRRT